MALSDIIGRGVRGESGRSYYGIDAYASRSNVTDKRALLTGKCNGKKVFIKYVRNQNCEKSFHMFRAMKDNLHQNIVPLIDVIDFRGDTFGVYPFLTYLPESEYSQNLADIFLKRRIQNKTTNPHQTIGEISAIVLAEFLIDIAKYFRKVRVVETDLKPHNILVCHNNADPLLNLCDLEGCLPAEVEQKSNLLTAIFEDRKNYYFTNEYGAPELYYGEAPKDEVPITEKVMVYAIGRILASAFYSHSSIISKPTIKQALKQDGGTPNTSLLCEQDFWKEHGLLTSSLVLFNEFIPEQFREFIAGCIETNPDQRYKVAEMDQKYRQLRAMYDKELIRTRHRDGFKMFNHP